jgi:hypothetical protein
MRGVTATLPVKIDRRIAAPRGRWIRVAGPKALVTGPALEQRAIHREALVGEQPLGVGVDQHRVEERRRDLATQQPARFFEKVDGAHTASSIPRPTNQLNNRL